MRQHNAFIVGLTGQSGAGKTTVCDYFTSIGFGVINCDLLSREVVSDGSNCLNDLVSIFSESILNEDQTLNRKELARIVFKDEGMLQILNETIFPYILAKLNQKILELANQNYKIIIIDAPTLFESGANSLCDTIISILAKQEIRIARIMSRDSLTKENALLRINSQHSDEYFIQHSDYIVYNNGNTVDLITKLNTIANQIKERCNGN
ncbi:dephospho-CoA kinase [Paludicola sp. MB14-C6]|uniref:dephospho-CoA kinase n=1 Tax=Paludihabitans sp. MB14-C6 TaxID=3070656 RepID=UPI0027DC1545|nr:dephospho-CoA kinase [Paludicola sp. MB14-C6]WMJ22269.1 dephospho-CoA kinase [Paludicola sp. MB14-C6]